MSLREQALRAWQAQRESECLAAHDDLYAEASAMFPTGKITVSPVDQAHYRDWLVTVDDITLWASRAAPRLPWTFTLADSCALCGKALDTHRKVKDLVSLGEALSAPRREDYCLSCKFAERVVTE